MAELSEKLMAQSYKQHLKNFDSIRRKEYQYFRSMYEKDYDEIKTIIKIYYKDKPYDEKTFEEILLIHHDIIHKTLERLGAGIYNKEPIRRIVTENEDDSEKANGILKRVLDSLDYHLQVKEAFKRSLFVNIIGVEPIYRDNAIDLEILTPDMFWVNTGRNYYKAKSVVIERTNDAAEIYAVYWDNDNHYLYDSLGNEKAVEGNEQKVNPYKVIPISWLRMLKGNDFNGEPEWDLFLDQIAIDMKVTDYDQAEAIQRSGILHGINTHLATGTRIRPNKIIQTKSEVPGKDIKLDYLKLNTDFTSWKDSIDWRKRATLSNKGISGSSAQSDVTEQSGIAKVIDETSLEEKRQGYRLILDKFETDLLEKIRTVWNYHAEELDEEPIPDGRFEVVYPEQRPFETQEQKDKRREYELKFKIKNEIEILMEELELSEEELLERLSNRKEMEAKFLETGVALKTEQANPTLREKLLGAQNTDVT